MGFGWTELLIIFAILLLLFGASRLPGLARSMGEGINEFKQAIGKENELEETNQQDEKEMNPDANGKEPVDSNG